MRAFVFDANTIYAFQQERISSKGGVAIDAIDKVTSQSCIALDIENQCLNEWVACAGGDFPFALMDWVTDRLVDGGIRLFSLSDASCRKYLRQIGLPDNDHKWVRLAIGSAGRRIVTEDIDFFDPSKKRATASVKESIKNRRSGACAKSLLKKYGIDIMCLRHVVDEVATDTKGI